MCVLEQRLKIAESLRGQKILITGASGFVGRSLLEEGLRLNDECSAEMSFFLTIRSSNSFLTKLTSERNDVNLINASIGAQFSVDAPIDLVFHCATPASAELNAFKPGEMFDVNVEAAHWIIDNSKLLSNCPKVLFTSSGAVYGPQPLTMSHVAESYMGGPDVTKSQSAYAEGKRVAEFLFSDAGRKGSLNPLIARLFAFSGNGLPLDRHFAIGNFVRDALNGDIITIRGSGQDLRSYLDKGDMAIWLWKMASVEESLPPLNIGSSRSISILELANTVRERAEMKLGRQIKTEVLGQISAIDGSTVYVPSTSLAKQLLDVDEWTSLERSIDQMLVSGTTSD